MTVNESEFSPKPVKRGVLTPVLFALFWGVLAAGLVWAMASRYRMRMAAVALAENRFITTEWSLLQELKVQTDARLLEKDQEIADLRRRHLGLTQKNASTSELREIETRLLQADREREDILSPNKASTAAADSSTQALRAGLTPLVDPSRLPALLSAQIKTLQAQLEERRLYARVLEEQLMESAAGTRPAERADKEMLTENQRKIQALSVELAAVKKDIETARATLARKNKESSAADGPGIEDLNTWTLLRALASSPEVRSEHPDLLRSMDRYLELYGRQERLKGNFEAYSAALEIVRSLGRGTGGP